ncbi:regulator domain-containing protein [Pseudomonas saudimassiliensis]|uniref:Regulator domain-containing protein n=1 Tax=Pseudomonas saudimassiliensis TaxID=1461581 RepID=A0A078M7G7_9PSED|nr:winged helix-turn-helix domain-containing protein [Pseudomonas saudimassiliensis]CEA01312.1 regulator domain-containing protein [Pseudomonas saudimassiliensis]CEF25472.1 regulator domain-containing protein [Pseudomonas saudimassiliensis]
MDLLQKRPLKLYRYFFGTAEFNEARFELRINERPVAIERRPLVLLAKILEHADQVVTKAELLHTVWGGRITVENVLANAMAKLRKALGDNAGLLVTIPRVGYRIQGPVKKMEAQADCALIPAPPRPESVFTSARIAPPVTSFHYLDVISLNPTEFDRSGTTLDAGTSVAERTERAGGKAFHPEGDPTLEAWAGRRHLDIMPIEQRLSLFLALAKAVSLQHARGTVHAFLQPDNLLVADNGSIRITAPERRLTDAGQAQKATVGYFYRAPETYRDNDVSPRSDIYSLGILLYQLLTSDFNRPLLPDWRQDITNRSFQHLIEAATHSCPSLRPESVEEFVRPLYTHRIGHHQQPEFKMANLASMLRR